MEIQVESPNVKYFDGYLEADYEYLTTKVEKKETKLVVSLTSSSGSFPAAGKINNI